MLAYGCFELLILRLIDRQIGRFWNVILRQMFQFYIHYVKISFRIASFENVIGNIIDISNWFNAHSDIRIDLIELISQSSLIINIHF